MLISELAVGLPKANRLKRRQDFQRIYQKGIRHRSSHLVLRALPATGADGGIKIGITVSQKISKKAVTRNRLRRQIQAALCALLPSLSPGWQVIVAPRPQAVECKYEHFLRELKQLFIQAEILHGNSRDHVL